MNKKIKILSAIFRVETSEETSGEHYILLDKAIKIREGVLLKQVDNNMYLVRKYNDDEFDTPLETKYVTLEELKDAEIFDVKETTTLKPRKTTPEEKKLINDYINKELDIKNKDDVFDISENSNVVSFDISDSHVVVYEYACFLDEFNDGKKMVRNFNKKYSIRHGIVFEYEDDQKFDDFDEDISEIQDLL